MRARSLLTLIATILAIAPLTATTATLGQSPTAQNSTTAKRQQAINAVSKLLKVPASELQVTSEVKIDSNLTQLKVLHTKTGRISGISLNPNNSQVPVQQVQAILASKQGLDFKGKLERALADRVSSDQATGTSSVVIWTKASGAPPIDRAAATSDQAGGRVTAFRSFHKNATEQLRQFIKARGGLVKYQSDNAPLLVVSIPNKLLSALEQRNDVQSIQLERTYKSDLNVAAQAVGARPTVWDRGITGSGVKVAVVEDDGINYAHPSLADGTYCKSNAPNVGPHASGVAGSIASTDTTNRGIAYGVPAVLSGNTGSYTDSEIIKCTDWAINSGARIINYSFSVNSNGSLVALDRYVDYVVRNRGVTLMKSAGNIGSTCSGPSNNVTSPGIGWNMITVGSYDDRNTVTNSDDIMSSFSCYGNPTSPHGDHEKPELTAPGSNITTTYTTSSSNSFASVSGTSFSTPITAGCAALLMQRNTALQSWPESIKAVLMATAVVNLEGSTRLSDKDGAGGIACDYADDVLRGTNGSFESHGSFSKSDFPKTYTFTANAGETVRMAIAWDSTTDTASPPTTDELKADFDLTVTGPSGTTVAYSTSWDNSYELVDFTAPTTGTYTAKVNAYRFDGSSEYLGVAAWKGTRKKS
jgi:serine protease AprX